MPEPTVRSFDMAACCIHETRDWMGHCTKQCPCFRRERRKLQLHYTGWCRWPPRSLPTPSRCPNHMSDLENPISPHKTSKKLLQGVVSGMLYCWLWTTQPQLLAIQSRLTVRAQHRPWGQLIEWMNTLLLGSWTDVIVVQNSVKTQEW